MNKEELSHALIESISQLISDPYSAIYKPKNFLQIDASVSTLEYIKSYASNAILLQDRFEVLSYVSKMLDSDLEQVLEFGVFKGTTINHIAKLLPMKQIYGFDSFDGLPEQWSGYIGKQGDFNLKQLPHVEDNVTLLPGWFNESIDAFLSSNQFNTISLLHIDSDLYSSAKTILSKLESKIVRGTIIIFDEYFNYPNWKNHEYKAFQEFIENSDFSYEYLAIGHHQVAVKIT